MNQFNSISIRQSSYSRKHRKHTHLSGFWTAPFWTTSFLGNWRIIKNSKILWRAVPSNRSVWILSIWSVWSRETRDERWWVRETSLSFNPLPWLQRYTYRENKKHLPAYKIDIGHPFSRIHSSEWWGCFPERPWTGSYEAFSRFTVAGLIPSFWKAKVPCTEIVWRNCYLLGKMRIPTSPKSQYLYIVIAIYLCSNFDWQDSDFRIVHLFPSGVSWISYLSSKPGYGLPSLGCWHAGWWRRSSVVWWSETTCILSTGCIQRGTGELGTRFWDIGVLFG